MRGLIKIRRHGIARKLSDISQIGPGAADLELELKCMYNSPIFYFRETRKIDMSAASKCNEIISGIITPRAIPQRNQLSLTMKL